jgi:hypothetical protein
MQMKQKLLPFTTMIHRHLSLSFVPNTLKIPQTTILTKVGPSTEMQHTYTLTNVETNENILV